MPFTADDHRFMARAIQLAEAGLYTTDPNPRVGCVLVKDGQVIGEGFHARAGEGHAEVNALAAATASVKGATAYVTLEPCSHHGKTPPCAEALVGAGVARVISAMGDPNPLVSGRGHQRLADAGIEVQWGLLKREAERLNPGFIKRMRSGLPYVRIKQAMSLDGRTAMASGESQWITGPAARSDVQRLRARSSAIITGIDSLLLDDSSLTLRAEELGLDNAEQIVRRQPLRVVVDSRLRMPTEARMLSLPGETLVVTAQPGHARQAELEAQGATVLCLPGAEGRVDLEALLRWLAAQRQCNEVLVEAGATLSGAFLQAGLADELWIYMAAKLMGSDARPLFQLPLAQMAHSVSLTIEDLRSVGADWKIVARPTVSEPKEA